MILTDVPGVTGKGFVNTAGGFLKAADSRTFPQLSNGRVALVHIVVEPGCIVQLHWHLQNDELVYVINGYGRVATVGVSAERRNSFRWVLEMHIFSCKDFFTLLKIPVPLIWNLLPHSLEIRLELLLTLMRCFLLLRVIGTDYKSWPLCSELVKTLSRLLNLTNPCLFAKPEKEMREKRQAKKQPKC